MFTLILSAGTFVAPMKGGFPLWSQGFNLEGTCEVSSAIHETKGGMGFYSYPIGGVFFAVSDTVAKAYSM